jgi:hypothetical protein
LDIVAERTRHCVTIDGVASGRVGRADYDLDVSGLSMCPDECPREGTVHAEIDGPFRDRSLTVVFDGSDVARVDGSSGRSLDVLMECTPVAAGLLGDG